MLHAEQRSNKYQFYSLWFDLIGSRTHDLQHANHYITDAFCTYLKFLVEIAFL